MRYVWHWIAAFIHCGITVFETNPRWEEIDQACLGDSLPDKKPRNAPAVAGEFALQPIRAATPYKAAVWLMLQSGEAQMTDKRVHANGVIVTDPVQQWQMLYHDTRVACLN